MKDSRLLKVRMTVYFLLSGVLALGAFAWKKLLTSGTMEWSGWSLAGYFMVFIGASVFLWAALRLLSRIRASASD